MSRVVIIVFRRRLLLCGMAFCLAILAAIVLITAKMHSGKSSQVFTGNESNGEFIDILKLEKENGRLRNLFSSLIPEEQKAIFEDGYRNIFMNTGIAAPPPLPAVPLSEVLARGIETKFRILLHDPGYLRPVYDPDWMRAYYRCWLYLPYKNIEARHKIFALSIGGSQNYDITGSLGFSPGIAPRPPEAGPDAAVDNHRNINFIIYGFRVNSVRVFQNQVALTGKPEQSGAWMVSIVQNDLLPEGVNTKDFLFELSTPEGYEVDFLNYNIIRYEYLMEQIKEHTVHPSFSGEDENSALERLLKENAALRQELSFFIPLTDEVITQKSCEDAAGDIAEADGISAAIRNGREISFSSNYENPLYKRPLYDPLWKTFYKRKWCYIPEQIESGMHMLHIIPQNGENLYDFFGTLGFHEKYQPLKPGRYGFLIYGFRASTAIVHKDQLLFIGKPSRTGAEIVSISSSDMKGYDNAYVRLVTPDNSEIDCRQTDGNHAGTAAGPPK